MAARPVQPPRGSRASVSTPSSWILRHCSCHRSRIEEAAREVIRPDGLHSLVEGRIGAGAADFAGPCSVAWLSGSTRGFEHLHRPQPCRGSRGQRSMFSSRGRSSRSNSARPTSAPPKVSVSMDSGPASHATVFCETKPIGAVAEIGTAERVFLYATAFGCDTLNHPCGPLVGGNVKKETPK